MINDTTFKYGVPGTWINSGRYLLEHKDVPIITKQEHKKIKKDKKASGNLKSLWSPLVISIASAIAGGITTSIFTNTTPHPAEKRHPKEVQTCKAATTNEITYGIDNLFFTLPEGVNFKCHKITTNENGEAVIKEVQCQKKATLLRE